MFEKNPQMMQKLIEGRDTPLAECIPENKISWDEETPNEITIAAVKETEEILKDPDAKYYTDVEEALKELKNSAIGGSKRKARRTARKKK